MTSDKFLAPVIIYFPGFFEEIEMSSPLKFIETPRHLKSLRRTKPLSELCFTARFACSSSFNATKNNCELRFIAAFCSGVL